jgi:hypothetical protein
LKVAANCRYKLRMRGPTVFIVAGKWDDPGTSLQVIRDTCEDALETANDLIAQGIPSVTISADGHVYTTDEFALTFVHPRD